MPEPAGSLYPPLRSETASADDGRTLTWCEWGDPDGSPVVSLHGTPGSRFGRHPDANLYRRVGVRLLTYDRAGYGGSGRLAGRDVASVAGDVAAVADAAGVGRFAVTGGSGGGPHSLAVAAQLTDRVTRCACVVGVAPFGPDGLAEPQWLAGMASGNVDEFRWAQQGEERLRPELERLAAADLARLDAGDPNVLGEEYELSDADTAVIGRPEMRAIIEQQLREAHRSGVDGWLDDDIAFVRPWGFRLDEIRVPVQVWYGEDDTLVPPQHGRWLAEHVPGAEPVLLDGGHLALVDRAADLMRWLTGR